MSDRMIPRSADGRFAPHENVRDLVALPDEWIFESLWRRILAHANEPVSVMIPGRRRQRMTRFEARVLAVALGNAHNVRGLARYFKLVQFAVNATAKIDRHQAEAAIREALSIEMAAALEANDEQRWRTLLQRFVDRVHIPGFSERELMASLAEVQDHRANRAGS
jgi:hypothetical protein